MTTFRDLLTARLRTRPGDPMVTFYDEATGERTELSATTYANWVAKSASLLVDELGLDRGDRVLVDLPPHWLGPVFLGAAWSAGLEVVWDGPAEAVVCGPDGLEARAGSAGGVPVVASALLPLGVRFPDGVPAGVHDFGLEVWGQPDAFVAPDPPLPADPAVAGTSHAELWSAARSGSLLADGGRLLSTANPCSPTGLATFTQPLALGGSLVLAVHADEARLAAIGDAERATSFAGPEPEAQPTRS
ncbi:MAG: TIGR03089 family protein [Nocardioidaceae bacterium]